MAYVKLTHDGRGYNSFVCLNLLLLLWRISSARHQGLFLNIVHVLHLGLGVVTWTRTYIKLIKLYTDFVHFTVCNLSQNNKRKQ